MAGIPRNGDESFGNESQKYYNPSRYEYLYQLSVINNRYKPLQNLFIPGEDIVFLATDINLPGAVDWVMMQSCFNHHFMLVLEKQEKYDGHQQFFAIVQLIGSRKQAENFAYR